MMCFRRWGLVLGLLAGSMQWGCAASPGSGSDAGRDAGRDAGPRDAGDPFRDASGRNDGSTIEDAEIPIDADPRDSGTDAGESDAGMDAGTDVGRDAGMDAGTDAGTDAGMTMPVLTVDGVVSDAEWMGATRIENTVPTNWGATQNRLDALRTIVDGGRLWIAVEGLVESTNAIVVYVDTDLPDTTTGLSAFSMMTDASGSLDNALSALFTVPSNFYVDFAWGTRAMGTNLAPVTNDTMDGFNTSIGWRDVALNPMDFAWVGHGDAPVECGASACETSIALTRLGATSGDQIAMFVRLTNAMGNAFNSAQRLPMEGTTLDTQNVGMLHVVTVP
jgi:hypothetical protein